MKQWDFFWADLPASEQASNIYYGKRPVIIVSNDLCNTWSSVLTVIPLTTNLNKKAMPTHVFLSYPTLDSPSLAICEQIMSIDKTRLLEQIGSVSKEWDRMAITHAIQVQLGMTA